MLGRLGDAPLEFTTQALAVAQHLIAAAPSIRHGTNQFAAERLFLHFVIKVILLEKQYAFLSSTARADIFVSTQVCHLSSP
ncbi:MAG: hypothetical protein ACRYGK_01775 [Janthinobacterium lividum]